MTAAAQAPAPAETERNPLAPQTHCGGLGNPIVCGPSDPALVEEYRRAMHVEPIPRQTPAQVRADVAADRLERLAEDLEAAAAMPCVYETPFAASAAGHREYVHCAGCGVQGRVAALPHRSHTIGSDAYKAALRADAATVGWTWSDREQGWLCAEHVAAPATGSRVIGVAS